MTDHTFLIFALASWAIIFLSCVLHIAIYALIPLGILWTYLVVTGLAFYTPTPQDQWKAHT